MVGCVASRARKRRKESFLLCVQSRTTLGSGAPSLKGLFPPQPFRLLLLLFSFQPQPNQDDPSLMCPEVNLVLIILKGISGSLSPRQLQIPINVTVNIKHGRWNLSCCSVGSQNVFTEVHPSSSWSLGLLVAGLSPGLSFYNEDPLMNFILYILTG